MARCPLEEVRPVHAQMFKVMGADKDGGVTPEEMQQFTRS
jgi:hypothetical protein